MARLLLPQARRAALAEHEPHAGRDLALDRDRLLAVAALEDREARVEPERDAAPGIPADATAAVGLAGEPAGIDAALGRQHDRHADPEHGERAHAPVRADLEA